MPATVIRLRIPDGMLTRIRAQGERLAFEGNLAGSIMHLLRMGLLQAEGQSGATRQASATEEMAKAFVALMKLGEASEGSASTKLDTKGITPDKLGEESGDEIGEGEGEESET